MPKILKMPSKAELPDGAHRSFVEEMHLHYREAGRPSLREIATWIAQANNDEKTEMAGTASVETVRRVLSGTSIPRRWPTVEAILLAFCGLADRDPDQPRWDETHFNAEPVSFRTSLKQKWNEALDDEERLPSLPPRPQPPPPPSQNSDPWAISKSSFDEEPPF